MATKSSKYWEERLTTLEETQLQKGQKLYAELEGQYRTAISNVEKDIAKWYTRFTDNNEISLAEAKKLLNTRELEEFKWDVKQYIKYGRENALDQRWMKELENASARVHVSKLESIKLQIQQQAEVLYGNQLDGVDRLARNIYSEGYYHTAYEIQKGFNIGWDLHPLNEKQIQRVISKPWTTDNRTFSDRIWTNKQQLVGKVHTELTQALIRGDSPGKAIKTIAKEFDVDKNKAGRLIMTESAFFASSAQKDCFNDLDVEQFEVVATLDNNTSKICQDLDGKVFKMKDYEIGVTAPPFHPWCRTVTVPYFDDNFTQRAAKDVDGKTHYVPSNTKYEDWKKSFVDGGSKDGLKPVVPDDTIEEEQRKETIQKLDKLKRSGMDEHEYEEYLNIINSHDNDGIFKLYKGHGDGINAVKKSSNAAYSPSSNSLTFDYPMYDDMNKYETLAHEYGHFFDSQVKYEGLSFKEITEVQNATGLGGIFKNVASSSDEFLAAIRKDKEHIRSLFTPDVKEALLKNNASSGVQDVIDGLFPKSRIRWGHGEKYYNRKYADIVYMDKISRSSTRQKALQQVYKDLGFNASNQSKVKVICRQYEAASEAWAHLMSAETCGGEALEFVKTYLPHSYESMLEILKGVK